ncbi:MAG: hypothetical protein ACFHHU_12310 [Porticoccaceae bacterium]
MLLNWFKFRVEKPKTSLVIFGTEFGSYQLLQLVQSSSKYRVAGFVSTDSWQKRSGFGKIGVIFPTELNMLCKAQNVAAILVSSDQKESFEKDEDMQPVREQMHLVRYCETLEIPQAPNRKNADAFIESQIEA